MWPVLPTLPPQTHMATAPQSRNWIFTLNNPDGALSLDDFPGANYLVYQEEFVTTYHFQGYVQLNRSQRMSYLRNCLPGAHFESARGTASECRNYCTKDASRLGGPYEFGTIRDSQGARNDLAQLMQDIRSGSQLRAIAENYPSQFIRYSTGISKAIGLFSTRRSWKTHLTVVLGDAGLGKTYWAMEQCGTNYYCKSPNNKWFDNYSGEETVLFDEFNGHWFEFSTWKCLFDATPMSFEIKGATVPFLARSAFLTSNFHPHSWYEKAVTADTTSWKALVRRIDRLVIFTDFKTYTEYTDPASISSYLGYE